MNRRLLQGGSVWNNYTRLEVLFAAAAAGAAAAATCWWWWVLLLPSVAWMPAVPRATFKCSAAVQQPCQPGAQPVLSAQSDQGLASPCPAAQHMFYQAIDSLGSTTAQTAEECASACNANQYCESWRCCLAGVAPPGGLAPHAAHVHLRQRHPPRRPSLTPAPPLAPPVPQARCGHSARRPWPPLAARSQALLSTLRRRWRRRGRACCRTTARATKTPSSKCKQCLPAALLSSLCRRRPHRVLAMRAARAAGAAPGCTSQRSSRKRVRQLMACPLCLLPHEGMATM